MLHPDDLVEVCADVQFRCRSAVLDASGFKMQPFQCMEMSNQDFKWLGYCCFNMVCNLFLPTSTGIWVTEWLQPQDRRVGGSHTQVSVIFRKRHKASLPNHKEETSYGVWDQCPWSLCNINLKVLSNDGNHTFLVMFMGYIHIASPVQLHHMRCVIIVASEVM